jgi:RNA polymerase sigma-70 factor, ECF subfamily
LELIQNDMIEGCLQQNRKSQEQLYRHCHAPMLRVCRLYVWQPQEAAALYNAAMLKVFTGIGQYANKGDLMAWVRRIVVNTCIDHCRQQARFVTQPLEGVQEEDYAIDPDVYAQLSASDSIQLLQGLPPASAMVFNLFAIEGYKHQEIAELLGISAGTSKWHLNEARRLLKQRLQNITNLSMYSHVG